MQIRVFGFGIDKSEFPNGMIFREILDHLVENAGSKTGRKQLIHAGAAPVSMRYDRRDETWHAGLVFRARDAKSFNQLIDEGGELILTAKQLEGGNKLAELCYFLVSPDSGKGLIACYHGGPSIPVLKQVLRAALGKTRRPKLRAALDEVGADVQKKQEVIDAFRGDVALNHLVKKGTLKELFKELRHVTDLELRLSAVENTGGLFTKAKSKAVTEKRSLKFPLGFDFDDELLEEFVEGIDDDKVIEAKLIGKNIVGERKVISSDVARNKMVFDEKDYDALLGNFTLQLKDWNITITSSPVVAWLKSLTANPKTRELLLA